MPSQRRRRVPSVVRLSCLALSLVRSTCGLRIRTSCVLRDGCAFISGRPLDRGHGSRSCSDAASRYRSGVSAGPGAHLAYGDVAGSGAVVEARFLGVSGSRRARWGCRSGGSGSGVSRRRRAAVAGALRMAADFYEVLEIPDTADEKEIKRAYRRKALKTHPDVNSAPDAKAQFDEVVKAYEVLSDEKQKKTYDRKRRFSSPFGRGRANGSGSGGTRAGTGGSSWGRAAYDPAREEASRRWREQNPKPDEIDDSFGDIFRDFIGGVATVGAGGVLNDVVDFLENRVDSFSSDTSVEFEDLMSSDNLEEAMAELENTRLLLEQLQKRIRKLDTDRKLSEKEVAASRAASNRMQDIDELDRQMALIEKAAGIKARFEEMQGHVKRAKSRLGRLERKVADLKSRGGSRSYTSGRSSTYQSSYSSSSPSPSSPQQPSDSAEEGSRRSDEQQGTGGRGSSRSGSSSKKPPPATRRGPGGKRRTDDPDVEAELARMKREMGL